MRYSTIVTLALAFSSLATAASAQIPAPPDSLSTPPPFDYSFRSAAADVRGEFKYTFRF